MNHLDGATAPAPLNAQGLWWSWRAATSMCASTCGRRRSRSSSITWARRRATAACKDGFECAFANLAPMRLDGFDPDADEIVVDAAQILAGVDVERVPDGVTDSLPGCMAFPGTRSARR
jgi:hypothetical protein